MTTGATFRTVLQALVLATALLPREGLAQSVAPGSVATIMPEIAGPHAGEVPGRVRWRIEPIPGVRVFEPLDGVVPLPQDGTVRLPIAAWIERGTPPGPFAVATVVVTWPDGRKTRHPVEVRVSARRRPALEIGEQTFRAAPGETVEIPVGLRNRGNLADTIGVRAEPPAEWGATTAEERRVVLPNDRVIVPVHLLIPPGAHPGEVRRIGIAATGRDSAASAAARVLVVRPGGIAGFETLPTAVFVGTVGGTDRRPGENLVAAVDARGRIGRETGVWLSARDAGVVGTAPAFHRFAGGSELSLGLRRPAWEASFGEVAAGNEPLVGGRFAGRGGEVRWEGSRARLEAFLARPYAYGRSGDGHLALGAVALDLDGLGVGLVVSDLARPFGTGEDRATSRGAALTFELDTPSGHRVRAEAGALRIADASGREASGPAGEIDWGWRGEATTLRLLARGTPGTGAGTGSMGNALSLAAHRRIAGPFSASGRGFWTSYPALDPRSASRHRGGSGALRYASGSLRLEVGAGLRHADYHADIGAGEERSAWVTAHLPLGPARLDVRAEAAVERSGDEEASSRSIRATVPWSGRLGWLSAGLAARSGGLGGQRLRAQAAGEVELSPLTLGGAVYLRRVGGGFRSEGYGSATVEIGSGLATVLGVERNGAEDGGWSFALGIRKRFGMPLPFHRAAAVSGVIFEDRDSDGRRDESEPGLPGVRVWIGPLEAVSDGTGRFRFEEAPTGTNRVRIDLTTLEAGSIAPPEVATDGHGRVEVPVVRPGSIEVRPFLDGDGDGIRDPDEGMPVRARIEARDASGRVWTTVTDEEGLARFRSLVPGSYRLVARTEASVDADAVEAGTEVEVGFGAAVVVELPLESALREIRFEPDSASSSGRTPPGR